jgi:carboxymethylenebutenolidase
MSDIKTEDVKLTVDGAPMPTYVAAPSGGGKKPAIIVFEEIFGVNKHIRDVTERLAREGYVAAAPDYHHRAWEPGTQRGYSDADMKEGMKLIPKLTFEGVKADIDATIAYLKTRSDVAADKLGAIGFCIGGHMAYFAAENAPIKATASFYGGGIASFGPGNTAPTVTRTNLIKGSILCFFGGHDPMISQDQVAAIQKALADAHVKHEVVIYDDATHGFFCDQRGSYNPARAAEAWEKTKAFFAAELK